MLVLALVAPAALASVPRSGAALGAPDLAPLSLERALATGDVVDSSSGFVLFRGDELRPQPLTVFEPSYPETRVRVFDFLGTPLVGVSSGVSHELHWGCGDFGCGFSEGVGNWLSEDPQGDVDSPNRYAYVGWRPNEATDPTGEALWVGGAIGGAAGGLGGIGYGLYRSSVYGEEFSWRYAAQFGIAGAAIGSGAALLGSAAGATGAAAFGLGVSGGTALGGGIGGGVSSVVSMGDWGAFGKGTLKGGILGGIGAATSAGIAAEGLSGWWAFGGSFAADTISGTAVDYAFGDQWGSFSSTLAWNAAFSFAGNALAHGTAAALRAEGSLWISASGRERSTLWENVRSRRNRMGWGQRGNPLVADPMNPGQQVTGVWSHAVVTQRELGVLEAVSGTFSPRVGRGFARLAHGEASLVSPYEHALVDPHYFVPGVTPLANPLSRIWYGLQPRQRAWAAGAVGAALFGPTMINYGATYLIDSARARRWGGR